jgi:DUF1680 family protein
MQINIEITDLFWSKKMEMISKEVIPYQWEILNDSISGIEPSHAVENFRIAAGEKKGKFYGMVFQDSDVAKWLEAASYSLSTHPNPELETEIDDLIVLIEKAQRQDGYLNTYFTVEKPDQRWKDMSFGHELYCAGHLIEAAVAYYQATGKDRFLNIVCRYADHIDSVFGPQNDKMQKYPGHEEIELALIKLYRTTGKERYLNLSRFFLEERGKQPSFLVKEPTFGKDEKASWFDLEYHQAHARVREHDKATGHAVRAMYLYSAMADLALEDSDRSLFETLEKIWDNMTSSRMYITGGLGSQGHAERFTFDYDLPNDTAHAETCASIGLLFWAHRMLNIQKNRKYSDVFEKALYNGVLSGISWDGKSYFYTNPLEVYPQAVENRYDLQHIRTKRLPWYGCACCPPNLARLITNLSQYLYSYERDTLYVHHYIGSRIQFSIDGHNLTLTQSTNYPWEGDIRIQLDLVSNKNFTLALRIPYWCQSFIFKIDGKVIEDTSMDKGYLKVNRTWKKTSLMELKLEMNIELIQSNPKVRDNRGLSAIQRGPIVYCLEEVDNGSNLADISLTDASELKAEYDPGFFGGMNVIKGTAVRSDEKLWENILYQAATKKTVKVNITAVPYFIWGNRKPGEMLVWIGSHL